MNAKAIASELRSIRKGLDKLRADMRASAVAQASTPVAVKRAVAAKMMGLSLRKLEVLIANGRVRTAEDAHLVPVAEVKRYCAPKTPRARRPVVGHRERTRHVDGQSEEAVEALRERLRAKT